MQPFAKFRDILILRTVVNSQIEVELCASAAVQDGALANSVGKPDFVANARSFTGEVCDRNSAVLIPSRIRCMISPQCSISSAPVREPDAEGESVTENAFNRKISACARFRPGTPGLHIHRNAGQCCLRRDSLHVPCSRRRYPAGCAVAGALSQTDAPTVVWSDPLVGDLEPVAHPFRDRVARRGTATAMRPSRSA
jgi:hypothetical protein